MANKMFCHSPLEASPAVFFQCLYLQHFLTVSLVGVAAQMPQAQQASTFSLPQQGNDDLTAMMSQLDQQIFKPQHRQVSLNLAQGCGASYPFDTTSACKPQHIASVLIVHPVGDMGQPQYWFSHCSLRLGSVCQRLQSSMPVAPTQLQSRRKRCVDLNRVSVPHGTPDS